eukprot:Anaeramoba_ignava/a219654_85.p1 GENE.a219654_85~~a219654_85.p1  ORF type:complete len:683 (-),score=155.51 a219654_85:35-2083(-)
MDYYWILPKSKSPPIKRFAQSGVIIEDDLYFFGGLQIQNNEIPLNDIVKYNLNENSWKRVLPKIPKMSFHGTAEYNGKLFIYGGVSNNNRKVSNVFSIDLKTFEIQEISPQEYGIWPESRSQHVFIGYDNWAYLLWGNHEYKLMDQVFRFNMDRCKWELIYGDIDKSEKAIHGVPNSANVTLEKSYFRSGFTPNLFGNDNDIDDERDDERDDIDDESDSREEDNDDEKELEKDGNDSEKKSTNQKPIDNNFDEHIVKDLSLETRVRPKPRILCSSSIYKDSIAIFGGFEPESEKSFNDFWFFHLPDQKWTEEKDFYGIPPTARKGHQTAVVNEDLILFGGTLDTTNYNDQYVCEVFIFNFESETWKRVEASGSTPQPRMFHSMMSYPRQNQVVGCFGLGISGEPLNDVFCLQLPVSSTLVSDLKNLFIRQELCDVVVKNEIKAHSCILKARVGNVDKFLRTCYQVDENTIKSLLIFIYSGTLPLFDQSERNEVIELAKKLGFKVNTSIRGQNVENLKRGQNLNILHLKRDLKKLLQGKVPDCEPDFELIPAQNSDKDLQKKPQSIKVHKPILAARCDLFQGMFACVQSDENSAPDLSGRSYFSLKAFVNYLYSDSVMLYLNSDIALDLLDAVEFYGLSNNYLRYQCISFLYSNMTKEDVPKVRDYADRFEIKELQNRCANFD